MAPIASASAIPAHTTDRSAIAPGKPGSRGIDSIRSGIALLVVIGLPAGLRADPANPPFPPAATFRSLQLTTLDCGRENSAAPCEKARAMADPLLDHPLLSGRCKDVLWTIRQKATVAPAKTVERRDELNASARDVTVFCRQQLRGRPQPPTGEPKAPESGGFGFGTGGGR
jgi:hypothetical protein